MIAGTVEIQMLANLARLQTDMNTAKNMVGGAMKSIEESVSLAKQALGALGVGLGVEAFVRMVEGSIDMMEHLHDLNLATKVTVENLAGLRLAAKQSGSDLDSIASSINKLAQNMGKTPEKFKELGITAKDPIEAMKQLADITNLLNDPEQRAGVLATALGKSWQGAAPFLAEGSKKMAEMIENGKLLSGVTADAAREADTFNDKMSELKTTLEGARIKALTPLLPELNNIGIAMQEAAKEGGLLLAVWVGMGGAMTLLVNEVKKLAGIPTTELAAVSADVTALQKAMDSLSSSVNPAVRARLQEQLNFAKARLELLQHEKQLKDQADAKAAGSETKPDPKAAAEAAARAAKFLQDGKAAAAAYAELLKERSKTELDALKDKLQHENQLLDLQHQDNLIGDKAYYDKKLLLAQQAADGELKALGELRAAQQSALDKTTSGTAEYYKAKKDLEETEAKEAKVTRDLGYLRQTTLIQAAMAADQYKRSIESVNAQILQLTGRTAEASAMQAELQNRDLRKRAVANGNPADVAAVDTLTKLTAAQGEFNAEKEKLSEVNARLAISEERVANSQRTGAVSEMEAMAQIGTARQASIKQQEAIVANLQRIAELSGNPQLVLQAEQAAAALAKLRSEADVLGDKLNTIFIGAAGDELANFINHTKTARQAFNDFANTVVQQINRMATEAIAKKLFQTISGDNTTGSGGIGGWISAFMSGGKGAGSLGSTPSAAVAGSEYGAIPMASGGDFMVNRPTLFLAGEAGPERAAFSGAGNTSFGSGGGAVTVHNTFVLQGTMDRRSQTQIAAAAGEGVNRALGRNG